MAIINVIEAERKSATKGFCVWLTGLPAAGKTTIAKALQTELENRGCVITMLDGDGVMRQVLSSELGFTREDRDLNVQRAGFVAGEVVRHGGVAICALVSPYTDARLRVSRMIGPHFVEIYVRTPLHICEHRDPKGLYRRARAGELKHLTGVDDPYEEPDGQVPGIKVDGEEVVEQNVQIIIRYLEDQGLLKRLGQPAALMIGRFQPWHNGHRALFLQALEMEGYVVIGVRETHGLEDKNPFSFCEVKARIEQSLQAFTGRFEVRLLPNITNVVYGRDVGYRITRIELDPVLESISATNIRSTFEIGRQPDDGAWTDWLTISN